VSGNIHATAVLLLETEIQIFSDKLDVIQSRLRRFAEEKHLFLGSMKNVT
jgi:hypothetical protein